MGITEFIAAYATQLIEKAGYFGVFILMTLESMVFPVPSEAVMPFAGFLIVQGTFTFWGVIVSSTLGSIAGSLLSYYIGYFGGMPFVRRFGKYALLDMEELEATERFFRKRGELTIFVSRFIPVVRHLISIPAGTAKMNVFRVCVFTVLGGGLWNAFLAYAGYVLKNNWDRVMRYSHAIDIVVVLFLLAVVGLYVYRHVRKRRKRAG